MSRLASRLFVITAVTAVTAGTCVWATSSASAQTPHGDWVVVSHAAADNSYWLDLDSQSGRVYTADFTPAGGEAGRYSRIDTFDGTTLARLGTTPVAGPAPYVAVDPTTGTVWAPYSGSWDDTGGGYDAIDLTTGGVRFNEHVDGSVPVGATPDPAHGTALIVDANDNNVLPQGYVYVVDALTGDRVATIPIDTSGDKAAVDARAGRAYVPIDNSLLITVIDTNENEVVGSITLAPGVIPLGEAVNEDEHRMYIATNQGFVTVDTTTDTVVGDLVSYGIGGFASEDNGIAIDTRTGMVYLAGTAGTGGSDAGYDAVLLEYDPASGTVTRIALPGEAGGATDVAVNPTTGDLYVLTRDRGGAQLQSLYRLVRTAGPVPTTTPTPTPPAGPGPAKPELPATGADPAAAVGAASIGTILIAVGVSLRRRRVGKR